MPVEPSDTPVSIPALGEKTGGEMARPRPIEMPLSGSESTAAPREEDVESGQPPRDDEEEEAVPFGAVRHEIDDGVPSDGQCDWLVPTVMFFLAIIASVLFVAGAPMLLNWNADPPPPRTGE